MKALVQVVNFARVEVEGKTVGEIGKGFLILLGVGHGDTEADCEKLADKLSKLRIFADENGKMNLSVNDVGGDFLCVSQFTLYADCSSRRPGFTDAARPEISEPLYELVVEECRNRGFEVGTGVFGADMKVASVNDGPVTIVLDV